MRFRSSLATAIAAAVAAVVFTAASQPVEAAAYTWQSTSGGTPGRNWATGTSWQGGVPPAGNDLVFGAAGLPANLTTNNNLGNGFIVNGLSFTGSTAYTFIGNSLELRGDITNSSSANVQTFGTGFDVTTNKGSTVNLVTSGSFYFGNNTFTTPDGLAVSGGGSLRVRNQIDGNVSTAAGTTLIFDQGAGATIGDLTANGITQFGVLSAAPQVNSFTAGASSQTFLGLVDENNSYVNMNTDDLGATASFGGLLSLDFATWTMDPNTLTNGTQIPLFNNNGLNTGLSYSGNFSSVVATGTSTAFPTAYGPIVGAWTLDGGNWKSPNIANGANPAQYFEFQPSIGSLVVVPEPTQMVFVAGVGAALGMWRLRKLRRNGRDSDATAC